MECIWVYIPTASSFGTYAHIGASATNYGNSSFKFEDEEGGKVKLQCGGLNGNDPTSDTTLRIPKGEWVFIGVYHNRDSSNRKSQHVMVTSDGVAQYGSEFTGSTPRIGINYYQLIINNSDDAISSTNQFRLGMHAMKGKMTNPNFDSLKTIVLNQYTRTKGNFYSTLPSLTFDGNNKLTVTNFTTTDQAWPPLDGTLSSFTVTNSNKDAEWTISGASYGNGTYKAKYDKSIHGSYHPGLAFDRAEGAAVNEFHSGNNDIGNLSIEFPETVLIGSYELRDMTPSGSGSGDHSPTDWTFEGSNDGTTWVTLDTQSGFTKADWTAAPTRKFTISGNSTAYKHYRASVSAVVDLSLIHI